MPEYNKPFRTQTELLEQLKRRGLLIQDEREAIAWLGKVNYYRMTGYLYPFRQFSTETSGERAQRADNFVQDASFEIVRDLYDFDRRLRLHVLDAVERIEIAVRTAVTDALGQHDRFAYENQSLLRPQFFSTKKGRPSEYDEWKKTHAREGVMPN